jgi:tetraacyldisaccharide 4'-kinase
VLVVSDGRLVFEPVERSGDEPQLLARTLPGVPVLVCPDRYLAGMLAYRRFGATVVLLDDGFQHLELERDIDLLLVRPEDVRDELLPLGRLREPLGAARARARHRGPGSFAEAVPVGAMLGVGPVFTLGQEFATPRLVRPFGDPLPEGAFGTSRRLVAVAGIARPERFFKTVEALDWEIAQPMVFSDHHWFTRKDVEAIHDAVQTLGAGGVITTEKGRGPPDVAGAAARHHVDLRADACFHRAPRSTSRRGSPHGWPTRKTAVAAREADIR